MWKCVIDGIASIVYNIKAICKRENVYKNKKNSFVNIGFGLFQAITVIGSLNLLLEYIIDILVFSLLSDSLMAFFNCFFNSGKASITGCTAVWPAGTFHLPREWLYWGCWWMTINPSYVSGISGCYHILKWRGNFGHQCCIRVEKL